MAEQIPQDNLEEDLDGEDDGETEGQDKPKSPHRRLIIFIAVGVLIFGSIGGGLMYFAENPEALSMIGLDVSGGDVSLAEESAPVEESFYVELGEIITDLKVPRGKRGYIRLKIILETGSREENRWVAGVMPKIIDAAQIYLRQRTPNELLGSAGSEKARKEMLEAFNVVAKPSVIRNLLFRDFVVQGPTG